MGGADYLDPYREAFEDAGPRFEALLWKNPRAQIARFDAAIDTVSMRDAVVADLGCGLGDLALRLDERGARPLKYIGVEGVGGLAEAALKKISGLGFATAVHEADFVAEAGVFEDLVRDHGVRVLVFSGSLNTLKQREAERVLDRAWGAIAPATGAGLVFNFLSDRHGGRRTEATGPANRYDTVRALGWAMDRTPLVRFSQDYLEGHDATIAMIAG
ncbi:MAG: class I SAM-dependent methyltransferase [Planctomycetota bacterium]